MQDDSVGLAGTATSGAGLVPKAYAVLTFAFAAAGASYLFLANETLTVRAARAFATMGLGITSFDLAYL